LNDYFQGKIELGAHLNGDECFALGASFHAANLSHSFRVRNVYLSDGFSYEVQLELKNLDTDIKEGDEDYYYKDVTLFPYKKRFGTRKTISLTTF